jgi:hypothetical protein
MLRALVLLGSLFAAGRLAAECSGWSGFAAPVRHASSATQTVLVRDLNADGAPEVLASGNHVEQRGAISVFANRGDGTFAPELMVSTRPGEKLEDAADLDRDGITDLVVSNYWENGIAAFRGKGALAFDFEVPYATATHGGPTLIADYDRDGIPDLVSLSFGSGNLVRVHVFRGNGDGAFAPRVAFDTSLVNGASLSSRAINGALELLVSEHSRQLGLIRLEGGGIAVSRIPAGPEFDVSSTFADVNGDGIADIIDAAESSGPVGAGARELIFVSLGNTDGTFRERKQIAAPARVALPAMLRVADFDRDGRADLVVSDFQQTSLYVFRGDGAGNFNESVAIDAGGPVNAFAAGDVNRDGSPDLVAANDDGTIAVIINRGACARPRRRAVKH